VLLGRNAEEISNLRKFPSGTRYQQPGPRYTESPGQAKHGEMTGWSKAAEVGGSTFKIISRQKGMCVRIPLSSINEWQHRNFPFFPQRPGNSTIQTNKFMMKYPVPFSNINFFVNQGMKIIDESQSQ
jgi:hypothetical protein